MHADIHMHMFLYCLLIRFATCEQDGLLPQIAICSLQCSLRWVTCLALSMASSRTTAEAVKRLPHGMSALLAAMICNPSGLNKNIQLSYYRIGVTPCRFSCKDNFAERLPTWPWPEECITQLLGIVRACASQRINNNILCTKCL